jgi:biopolymer transport protein TolR
MPKVQSNEHGSGSGRARRGRGVRVSTSLAEINVIPLVDVMLVLLIIFMVTAPMMQQGLQVNLPQARKATPLSAQPIYVTVPADFAQTRTVQLDKESVRIDILHERLRQATLSRDEKSVFIRADAKASVQDVTTVFDKLKEAGIEKVGFITKPVER